MSLILFIAVLTLLGGPGADAFASAFFGAGGPTFYVTNNQDSGPGSLRQAILDADAAAVKGAPSTITVAAGVASLTIDPQSPLPGITGVVLLDGRGLITVNNTLAGARANGLALQPGSGGSEITGMTIIGAKWAAILLDSPGNLLQGNTIGGTTAASQENRYGVFMVAGNNTIGGAVANTIGGTGASAGNVISGNRLAGVAITGAGTGGNVVEGNFIGTDSAGNNTIGNGVAGVLINAGAANNTIGGTGASAGNVISGNKAAGVSITGADTASNLVLGNYIGTNPTGTGALSNQNGVLIQAGAVNNTIGGAVANTIGGKGAGAGNVISGNRSAGVAITGAGTSSNAVQGNYIGTQAGGTGPLGNGSAGILINGGATSNTVGGTVPGTRNVIAYNVRAGVRVGGPATAGASILGNSIFANGSTGRGPGIQLTRGANGSELPPTIKSLTPGTAGSMTISGTGKPGSRVEVFEDATCADPEGRQFVAAVVPMADGRWRVSVALLPAGSGVTATGTGGSTLDTSPFSRCSLVSSLSTVSLGSPT
ncbi:MAG: right-handed parallel beta-helix repeat-containing protein [Acidimicrobiales bacterium]